MCLRFECCCCFPLISGLIVWGYIKLLIIISYITSSTSTHLEHEYGHDFRTFFDSRTITEPIPITSLIFETGFTILMIVTLHMKHIKLYQVYFVYSAVRLALIIIGCGMIAAAFRNNGVYRREAYVALLCSIGIFLGIHIYIFSIEKSVLYKLKGKLFRPAVVAAPTAAAANAVNQNVVINTISQAPQPIIQPYMQPAMPYPAAYPAPGQAGAAYPPNPTAPGGMPMPQTNIANSQNTSNMLNPGFPQSPPAYDFKVPMYQ